MIVDGSSNDSPAGGISVVILAEKFVGGPGDFSITVAGARIAEKYGTWR
jgi:hypothetical protein